MRPEKPKNGLWTLIDLSSACPSIAPTKTSNATNVSDLAIPNITKSFEADWITKLTQLNLYLVLNLSSCFTMFPISLLLKILFSFAHSLHFKLDMIANCQLPIASLGKFMPSKFHLIVWQMHDTDRLEKSAEALTAERKDMVQKSNLTDDQLGWKYQKKTKGAATTTTESNNSKNIEKKMGFERLHPMAWINTILNDIVVKNETCRPIPFEMLSWPQLSMRKTTKATDWREFRKGSRSTGIFRYLTYMDSDINEGV